MGEFKMPSLGADMDAGSIIEWRVHPGDTVHRGDIVAVVDTEKSDIEVEIFEDGVIEELLVEPGVEVPVGTALARIRPGVGQTVGGKPEVEATPSAAPAGRVTNGPAAKRGEPRRPTAAPHRQQFVRASPLARRQAARNGIDLATVSGSGPGGAVRVADLAGAAPGTARAPTERAQGAGRDRHQAMRQAIATLMARSKHEIPHYYLATIIDLSSALNWLADANVARPLTERLLPAALLLKATSLAIGDVPTMNGFWDDGFRPSAAVHLGVAVSLRGGGLVAPAIHDADRLDLDSLMAALRDLVRRARTGTLRGSEVSDPTITVTNLGDQGVEEVFGVIYPPQVALVGFGRINERPWAAGGMLGVRPVVRATLAADHRVSDGHDGARFLAAIDRLLQQPEAL
jgi:pyruvate dehydrogenase E2 component (dihydrolipoamide acetyltransferase)